ncbi:methyltransferase domain-containing protein [Winogradskyella echinorum]|uniref:Methyltransferase domain-containing protein n=1 Tax=Winogradskyella echinorum TaxID=538189 RepID=A0ABR6XYJ5_9FLAO|nr:methyltransferase domain-containing protein [Winogradskyella echinorum]MBC3845574.1 methyltransferase domain-containing protein [Winogradskyella echinorum]MBC5749922.1 methyltransferase domain-containing protein [Winogradskyella echinorum]
MKILHPNNDQYCSLDELKNYYSNGYYSIISDDEKEKLNYFLNAFQDYRKTKNLIITDNTLYKNLPFSIHTTEWKERQKDVKIIDATIGNKQNLEILDVGSWNGWLCNYLTKKGHNLTGINFFDDAFDGLKTNIHYNTKFTLLQMQADELYRIEKKFDLIIFNRNWAFFQNHDTVFNDAKKLLSTNGLIIFTGLAIYKNPTLIKQHFESKNLEFKKRYNIPLFYNQSKGFLDYKDKKWLKKSDIKLNPYNRLKNILKHYFPKRPKIYFGIYFNSNL